MLPTFGEHMSVEFIHCSRAELSGAQLSTFFRAGNWAPDSWAPGPNCPPPKSGQLGPGQFGPGAMYNFS